MTQQAKVLNQLQRGLTVSASVAEKNGIRSLSKVISNLRAQGHCIYTNTKNGSAQYRIGQPSKTIVAAAYAAMGTAAFQ